MKKMSIFLAVSVLFSFLFAGACKEKEKVFWIENYDSRKVFCVRAENAKEELIKFEFNDGQRLSAIYWQRTADIGYLIDLRSGKLFIDASSGIFLRDQGNFYESLKRNIDIPKIKNSLTRKILQEFCRAIEKACVAVPDKRFLNPGLMADLENIKQNLGKIDLDLWYRAVDAEQDKIHALGLEYCISAEQAKMLFSGVDFSRDYQTIVGKKLSGRKPLVVCVTDNHPEDADKLEVMRALQELKPLDFGYFLLECVLTADQKILDGYNPENPASRTALLAYLEKEGFGGQSANLGGKGAQAYLETIDRAKKLGYQAVAIGNYQRGDNYQRDDIGFLRNNYWMALNVAEIFRKDPEARVITFTGPTHAFPNYIAESDVVLEGYLMRQDIPDIVKKVAGVDAIVFECIGGLRDIEFRKYLNKDKSLEEHVRNKGWHEKRFFIPVLQEISTLGDEGRYYYIHLPQS